MFVFVHTLSIADHNTVLWCLKNVDKLILRKLMNEKILSTFVGEQPENKIPALNKMFPAGTLFTFGCDSHLLVWPQLHSCRMATYDPWILQTMPSVAWWQIWHCWKSSRRLSSNTKNFRWSRIFDLKIEKNIKII